MTLTFIGAGFVGATTAAAMADSGHNVLVFDISQERVDKLGSNDKTTIESCLYERGLADLLISHKNNISFTTDYTQVESQLDSTDAIFICVPTPHREDGSTEMKYYDAALEQLATAMAKRNNGDQSKYIVLVNKSTVPIETATYASDVLEKEGVKNFGVVSNPEFLVEGKAIEGNLHPSRIVVGAWNQQDFVVMRNIYDRFYNSSTIPYIEVNPHEAAAGKLLANFLLFNRLMTCFNVVGRTAEKFDNVKFENIRSIITSDKRIGNWGFYDSLYAGGSCLEKDTKSLAYQLTQKQADVTMQENAIALNHNHFEDFLSRVAQEKTCQLKGASVAVLGMAFKQDTNDIRNSAGPMVLEWLKAQGVAQVQVYDPEVSADQLPAIDGLKITSHDNEQEAITNTSACFILTDWPRFRSVGKTIQELAPAPYCIVDGRRMVQNDYAELQKAGYTIIAVGSPTLS